MSHEPHARQPDAEDAPLTRHRILAQAIEDLLLAKGLFGPADLRRAVELLDAGSPQLGARLVARAWVDDGFAGRLADSVNRAAAELGIDVGPTPILALPDRADLHNVVVCTLCSCYPIGLLGLPPDWYKSREYRSRVVREPRAVLAEFGTVLPDDVAIRVSDSSADLRYLVVPMRPAGTEGWDEERLAAIVTRDCLIGTALPVAAG